MLIIAIGFRKNGLLRWENEKNSAVLVGRTQKVRLRPVQRSARQNSAASTVARALRPTMRRPISREVAHRVVR